APVTVARNLRSSGSGSEVFKKWVHDVDSAAGLNSASTHLYTGLTGSCSYSIEATLPKSPGAMRASRNSSKSNTPFKNTSQRRSSTKKLSTTENSFLMADLAPAIPELLWIRSRYALWSPNLNLLYSAIFLAL